MKSQNKRKMKQVRRKNAKLYPIYKMFSWDLLCFYSIEFLFLTITKKIDVADVLFLDAFYLLCKMIVQIPSVTICDFLGRKNSIVLGNALAAMYMLILIFAPNKYVIMLGKFMCAFGYGIKNLSEGNLLYDSVATKGGDGLYTKIDSKGGSMYYILEGTASLIAGYLFVINNYIPVIICFTFLVISTIISCGFLDVYDLRQERKSNVIATFKSYGKDLKDTCKFIFNSNRMKAFILFRVVFYSLVRIIDIYRSDLLLDVGVSEEQFSIIFAVFTFIAAIAVNMRETIEKKYKNRTLTFISMIYILPIILIGMITMDFKGRAIIPIILVLLVITKIATSIWYILEGKYLKNFTSKKARTKIAFTYEFIGCMASAIVTFLAGKLIQVVTIEQAFLLIGLIGFIALVLTLDYMRTRFGLKPKEYSKHDIDF